MTKRTGLSLDDAKARVADWEAEYEEHQRSDALSTRFQGATAAEVTSSAAWLSAGAKSSVRYRLMMARN